jgi:hypothetical protein
MVHIPINNTPLHILPSYRCNILFLQVLLPKLSIHLFLSPACYVSRPHSLIVHIHRRTWLRCIILIFFFPQPKYTINAEVRYLFKTALFPSQVSFYKTLFHQISQLIAIPYHPTVTDLQLTTKERVYCQ